MADTSDQGFLGRWSRLKTTAKKGEPTPAPQTESKERTDVSTAGTPAASSAATTPAPSPPAPTMQDVAQLTPASDYRSFVARDVSSEVKNAAMKKLFTDPHFNVMDRMDVYIDDYNQPDPLSPALLRQMASAKFLNLADDESDKPQTEPVQSVAQSGPESSPPNDPSHDHADLRLQPNPAPGQQGTGPESA